MLRHMLTALRTTLLFTVLTGFIYPGVMTALCQLIFPHHANGSMITANGQVVGSELIGQNFTRPDYFHSRPSAAGNDGYDASASTGSNLGPTSQKLIDRVQGSLEQFRKENPDYQGPIPADLLTASSSGLDPHISPAAAEAQVPRIARARGIPAGQVHQLVRTHIEGRDLGLLGEPRINVLLLNLALDKEFPLR